MHAAPGERIVIPPRCKEPLATSWTWPGIEADTRHQEESHPAESEGKGENLRMEYPAFNECCGRNDRHIPNKDESKQLSASSVFNPLRLEAVHIRLRAGNGGASRSTT